MKKSSRPSWLTPDGYLDVTGLPLDLSTRKALDGDDEQFHAACSLLGTMATNGRKDAGVFLLGLLAYCRDDLERLKIVVRQLSYFREPAGLDAVIGELYRVKSSNTTRAYLNEVLKSLLFFPRDMIQDKLLELAQDKRFSVRWRKKFERALWA